MPDTTKHIASLDFKIDKAEEQLKKLSATLEEISQKSESQFKNVAKNIEKSLNEIDYSKISDKQIKNAELTEKQLKQIKKAGETERAKQEERTQGYIERKAYDHSNKMVEMAQRQANQLELIEARSYSNRISNMNNFKDMALGLGLGVGSTAMAFNLLRQSASDTIQAISDVEFRMMEISRIMADGSINVQEYRDELVGLSYEYGRSFDDVSSATLNFARAGYDAQESILLTRQAMLALNTAELDASEATDGMISIMAQWGLNADTAEETAANLGATIDKINKVADNFPITSEGLLEALQRTSQGFNLAGASMEETIAMIVAAEKEAQRGGRIIGTAMANMVQQLKDDKKLDLAESLGLDFYTDDTKQEFKSVTDMFAEMSERMAKLKEEGKESSTEMQSLLELFTVFRRNIGAGLLTEMSGETSTYQQVLDTLSDSLGYSAQENSKYMSTMEAAKEQLNAVILDLQNTLGDQGGKQLFSGFILGVEGGAKALNGLINTFGLVPTAVTAVVIAFNLFSKSSITDKIKNQISGLKDLKDTFSKYNDLLRKGYYQELAYDKVKGQLNESERKYIKSLGEGEASLKGYLVTSKAVEVATKALKLALEAASTAIVSFAISKLVEWVDSMVHSFENATQALSDAGSKLDESNSKLEEYKTKYQQLRSAIDEGNLTAEERNKKERELITLQEEIQTQYKNTATSIDLVNGKYDEQIEKINGLGKANYQKYMQENKKSLDELSNTLDATQTEILAFNAYGIEGDGEFAESVRDIIGEFGNLEVKVRDMSHAGVVRTLEGSFTGTKEEILQQYRDMYDELIAYGPKVTEENQENYNKLLAFISSQISAMDSNYSESIGKYKEAMQQRLQYDDLYATEYAKIQQAKSDMEDAFIRKDYDKQQEAAANLVAAYQEAITKAQNDPEYSSGMTKLLTEQLEELQKVAEGNKIKLMFEGAPELKETVEEIIQDMGDISMQDLEEAFNTGNITENMQLLKDVLDAVGISTQDFFDNVGSLNLQLEETEPYVTSAAEAFEDMLEATTEAYGGLESLTSQFETVYTAMDQFNQNGYLTAEMLTNLTANDLLQYLEMVDGKLSLNEAAMVNAANAAKQKAIADLQEKAAIEIMGIANADAAGTFGQVATAADQARGPLEWIKAKVAEVAAQVRGGTADWIAYYKAMEGGKGGYENLSAEAQAEVDRIIANTQAQINIINSMDIQGVAYNRVQAAGSGRSHGGSGGSGSSGRTSTSSTKEEKNTILKDFKNVITEREKDEQRWVKKYKELEQLSYNDQKYILQQEVKRYKEYADEVMKLTGVTEEEKLKARKEYLQKAEDLEMDYIDLLEKELKDETKKIKDAATERVNSIKETAKTQIEALKQVEDENDRIREKEEYLRRRDEIIHGHQGIEYWEQRTGRAAQLALAEARKNLADLDREWKEKQDSWNAEDQIAAIEARRDADIAATEAERDAQIAALEEAFNYRVKQFAETGKLIYDDATIQSKNLYNTYKKNFIDPIGSELRQALAQQATATAQSSSSGTTQDYIIQWGDTLTSIANKFGTTIAAIMSANPYITNPNLIYAGASLKIPKSHTGSKVIKDGLENLQAGEIVLNTKWARDMDRMLAAYANNSKNGNTINNGNTVNVKGDMVKIEANLQDKSDINTLTRKVKKTLERQFSIN